MNEESDTDCRDIASASLFPSLVPSGEWGNSQDPIMTVAVKQWTLSTKANLLKEISSDMLVLMDVETSTDEGVRLDRERLAWCGRPVYEHQQIKSQRTF